MKLPKKYNPNLEDVFLIAGETGLPPFRYLNDFFEIGDEILKILKKENFFDKSKCIELGANFGEIIFKLSEFITCNFCEQREMNSLFIKRVIEVFHINNLVRKEPNNLDYQNSIVIIREDFINSGKSIDIFKLKDSKIILIENKNRNESAGHFDKSRNFFNNNLYVKWKKRNTVHCHMGLELLGEDKRFKYLTI